MNILITGCSGRLGWALSEELKGDFALYGCDKDLSVNASLFKKTYLFDITDREGLADCVQNCSPHTLIHTAALTDVDRCELTPDEALQVNSLATKTIAEICHRRNILLVYISTDYVFAGTKAGVYQEDDTPSPMSIYGKSKLEGESWVRGLVDRHLIIRTSRLFGRPGYSFVEKVLEKASRAEVLRMVDEERSSPTYSRDLAGAIKKLLPTMEKKMTNQEFYGIYHITNQGSCSWYEYARKILELRGLRDVAVERMSSRELSRPAPRPANSVLGCSRFVRLSGRPLRPWEEALAAYLRDQFADVRQ